MAQSVWANRAIKLSSNMRLCLVGYSTKIPDNQSTRAPEAFTTFSYFASSLAMNAPNCSGVLATGSAISVAKRVLASGEFSAATKAWLSLATTSLGVAAGATRPHQVSISKPLSVSRSEERRVGKECRL